MTEPQVTQYKSMRGLQYWRIYTTVAAGQGWIIWWLYLLRQPVSENSFFLGMSPLRLSLVTLFLAAAGGFSWLAFQAWYRPSTTHKSISRLLSWLASRTGWGMTLSAAGLIFLGSLYIITLTPEINEPFTQVIFNRLFYFLVWFAGLGFQTLLALMIIRHDLEPGFYRKYTGLYLAVTVVYSLIFLGWRWTVHNQLAAEIPLSGWNELGIPILETQVLLAWLAGIFLIIISNHFERRKDELSWWDKLQDHKIDITLAFVLWLGSVVYWNSIPIQTNWFVSEPQPPNQEFYPNSDALSYDMTAQVLLTGEGFEFVGEPYVRRPLHAIFLTVLHLLGGQEYEKVIFLQILVLALLPVGVYFLATRLFNRAAGLIAALLILLREANSIKIASTITASHAKLFMSDLPATLVLVWFLFIFVIWMSKPRKLYLGLLAGAFLGAVSLIRSELAMACLIAAGFTGLFHLQKTLVWLRKLLLVVLGLILMITPWIWRNYHQTGLFFLDSPSFRVEKIVERYQDFSPTLTPNTIQESAPNAVPAGQENPTSLTVTPIPTPTGLSNIIPPPVEPPQTVQTPTSRLPDINQVLQLIQSVYRFIRQNTAYVLRFITANFLNSLLQTFLLLPATFRGFDSLLAFSAHHHLERLWYECCSLSGYVRRLPFWFQWNGFIPLQSTIPIMTNLALITVGLNQVWKRTRWLGLFPLAISATHILLNAVVRNSGGRYILPVDWVGPLYFSIGLAAISIWFLSLFSQTSPNIATRSLLAGTGLQPPSPGIYRRQLRYLILTGLGIVFAGSLLPISETAFRPVYPEPVIQQLISKLFSSSIMDPAEKESLQVFISRGGKTLAGRALYPRYYKSNQGEPGSRNSLGPRPYPRLGFYLVGPATRPILLPLEDEPDLFPNAADVLVFGCDEVNIWAVAVFTAAREPLAFYQASPPPTMPNREAPACPLNYPFIMENEIPAPTE